MIDNSITLILLSILDLKISHVRFSTGAGMVGMAHEYTFVTGYGTGYRKYDMGIG